MTNVKLNFPKQVFKFPGSNGTCSFEGNSVINLIDHLEENYGNVKERLFEEDENRLRPYFNLFIGKQNINTISGIDSVIPEGETVSILLARAGG